MNSKLLLVLLGLIAVSIAVDASLYRNHIHNHNFKPLIKEPLKTIPKADLPANH